MSLACSCHCTGRFVSDLVGNPEDRFSHVAAQYFWCPRKLLTNLEHVESDYLVSSAEMSHDCVCMYSFKSLGLIFLLAPPPPVNYCQFGVSPAKLSYIVKKKILFEPPRGKPNNVVSDQVRHKPTYTVTEKS